MIKQAAKSKRVLHIKIAAPSADLTTIIAAMMKNALPLYEAFGDARVSLLRNVDDQARFLQVVEYQTDEAIELTRHRFASDPAILAWRSLFSGAIDIDVYEDITAV